MIDCICINRRYGFPEMILEEFKSFIDIPESMEKLKPEYFFDENVQQFEGKHFITMSKWDWFKQQEYPGNIHEQWYTTRSLFGGAGLIAKSDLLILSTLN